MILRKKLLIATDSFLPNWDGISRFLVEILPAIINTFEITILCPKFESELKINEKIKLVRLEIKKQREYHHKVDLTHVKSLVDSSDIIFVHSLGPIGKESIECAYKAKKPVILYNHSIYWDLVSKNRILEPILKETALLRAKQLYKKCSLIIVPSLEISNLLEKEGITVSKVIVKPGINIDKFKPPEIKDISKQFININPNKKVIGYVGRLSKEKDIITLYRAFKRLETSYNNLFLIIVGKGNKSIENLFKKDENIRLIKSTNNIVPYLQAMDIFVMPSLTETSAIAVLEAMSCALPIITTKVGDIKEYIKDKENGVFFSQKNDTLLSLKIEWLLKEEFVRKTFGLNARETIKSKFNLEETKEKIKKILESF